ncbi:MAG: hypothetical protein A4E60_00200 [Syntrophorhabdus sp. PtaB.Bin047]|nr:MAG: hypothetical protein A4E60_00200 [Syntrophorhabdus sp. PtaB.Bin047]
MSTKKPEKQKEPVYCIGCGMLKDEAFCTHREVMAKDPIAPNKAQWARDVNKNNDCPYFVPISKPKVYCMNCMSFRRGPIGNIIGPLSIEDLPDACLAPENMNDTHRAPQSKPDRKPSEINANNDCPWFKKPPYVQITVGDKFRELKEELDRLATGGIFGPTMKAGAAILSEIAPKRPWWKFWQRKEA